MTSEPSKFETAVLKIARAADVIALLLTTLVGIAIGVWQFAESPTVLLPSTVGVAITLLGLLGLHAAIQRVTVQRETNESLTRIAMDVQDISTRAGARNLYITTMRQYMKILKLKDELRDKHSEYGQVVEALLEEPLRIVATLAQGTLVVSTHLIPFVFSRLLQIYHQRHDAVSKDDLNFWQSNALGDSGYRQANYRAAKHAVTTRLFIFAESYFVTANIDRIASVVAEQMDERIGCALAIYEDFEHQAQLYKALDFALFDAGKAVSFFRGLARDYVVTFSTGETRHDADVIAQIETYFKLLPECLLVTRAFQKTNLAVADPKRREYLKNSTNARTERLKSLNVDVEDEIFPIVVEDSKTVKTKIEAMLRVRAVLNGSR